MKNHMFLAMAMAQVEAITTDTSQELSIAQGAVDSLNLCLDMLRTQANVAAGAFDIDARVSLMLEVGHGYGLDLDLDPFFSDLDFF
ncbi:hypothetical protein LTR09_009819 [Extremus antarcticus]|uniref:Uncharacterized protein n=1 Tax=Extremus antarcticus TaxID=702011 RepID=A0AAJ0G602_9PEZI|nr:hypothetical protein LTR09_009819 [Extremus antarcticus]